MSLPTILFGPVPETIEARLLEENAKNGHIGTIKRYTLVSNAPPLGIAVSFIGWDDVRDRYRQLFGEPKDVSYQALIAYEEKP